MTIIPWPVGRFTPSILFSESLRIVDYEGIFIKIKKKLRFHKYSAHFPKVQRFTNHLKFVSGRIWAGERDQRHYVFLACEQAHVGAQAPARAFDYWLDYILFCGLRGCSGMSRIYL